MEHPFNWFVVFAEMRTGSNFLETNLNAIDGITCYGEAFNPSFIGYPNKTSLLGVTEAAREEAPEQLLTQIMLDEGICGFRYFHDHDPRVLDAILDDPRCAKIILTRNPAESYVSWKIAQTTGQWKLTDVKRRKAAKATFDAIEFAEHVAEIAEFQHSVNRRLQSSGQTAFRIRYEDLNTVDVMNGIAVYLGASGRLDKLDNSLKVQNPAPLSDKVTNFDDMQMALAGADTFALDHDPGFEPRRSAAVPSYVAAARCPLLYLPVKGGPEAEITDWLAKVDSVAKDDLITNMSQKDLRQWKRAHKGHRSFTVLRHPVARAHSAYCRHILGMGKPVYGAIRQTLIRRYDLPLPETGPGEDYSMDDHRAGFLKFLEFLRGNLAGQTSIRVDASWSSQSQILRGFGHFALPDLILREDEMAQQLPSLANRLGCACTPQVSAPQSDRPFELADIYDDEIEAVAASVYQRDYLMFGFERWS